MTCDAFLEVAEAFALGVLEDGERLACAQHLADSSRHAGCLDAVLETQIVAARLAAVLPGRALRPGAWEAIESRLGEAPGEAAARGRRLWELADWLVAATVVGLYLYGAPVSTPRPRPFEGETPLRRPGHALPATSR
jgi:anti-sigma-K factor RskA